LLDVALTGGYVIKPSNGWYQKVDKSTGEMLEGKYREKETLNEEFWKPLFDTTDFADYLARTYMIKRDVYVGADAE